MTDYLNSSETAKLIGVSIGTMSNWRKRGYGPGYFEIGPKQYRYDRAEVVEWIANQRRGGDTRSA